MRPKSRLKQPGVDKDTSKGHGSTAKREQHPLPRPSSTPALAATANVRTLLGAPYTPGTPGLPPAQSASNLHSPPRKGYTPTSPNNARQNIAAASMTTWARPGSRNHLLPAVHAGGAGAIAAAQAEAAAAAARQRKTFIVVAGQRPAVNSPSRAASRDTIGGTKLTQ